LRRKVLHIKKGLSLLFTGGIANQTFEKRSVTKGREKDVHTGMLTSDFRERPLKRTPQHPRPPPCGDTRWLKGASISATKGKEKLLEK